MKMSHVLELPYPSTAIIRGPILGNEDGGLQLSMIFDEENTYYHFQLRFEKVRAFCKRAEVYCTQFHIKAYDVVCEISDSTWVDELKNDVVIEWRDRWVMRHFVIYIDSFGYLEVIAESAGLKEIDKNSAGTPLVSQTPFSA
ncbi:hypothetical protein [Xaviernesmea oryzae]|uniref:hypothetical protein n=1 Tax=Xaviernesmea oryzae TaxID=464029 RepID=UPI0008C248F6|nr:hypothetical protein [Xaviernesmea oryzae]SEM39133.1 hypothetical protein SAMN04487976_1382 [Xaviernesmea oryzae]